MTGISDEMLMEQVREGELRQLGVLFERYQRPLFGFYYRQTSDRTLAEDLVQEVFYRVLKYRDTFREKMAFPTWLYQIARNTRIDHFRKHGRIQQEELSPTLSSNGPQPVEIVERDQDTALLRQALARLDEEKRELLILSRYQNLKYREIGEIYGCEESVVKGRVFRALRDLREIYFELARRKVS